MLHSEQEAGDDHQVTLTRKGRKSEEETRTSEEEDESAESRSRDGERRHREKAGHMHSGLTLNQRFILQCHVKTFFINIQS